VPISKVGYFPYGEIKHSNEFLVALGDNYFIERTSQECQPIIDRRILKLQDQIKSIEIQLQKEEGLMKIAENINKTVLIGIDGKPVASESETHWDE
jgi:prefoldin subunit 5